MKDVFSIMIWLKESGVIPLEQSQTKSAPEDVREGHHSFVFNSPALPRVHYAHFGEREAAEEALAALSADIEAGKVVQVAAHDTVFAIPARSILYAVLGRATAKAVSDEAEAQ